MTDHKHQHDSDYEENSLTLFGAVSMGTGVMIGAGIFALTGQLAEYAGGLFPLAFLAAAVVCSFSAYSYVKVCRVSPSAGGVAMILKKCYGPGTITAGSSLLMYFSMVINESLVARTFGTYTLQLFDAKQQAWLTPALGVGLLLVAFLINISGNKVIGGTAKFSAGVKVGGIALLAIVGLWTAGTSFETNLVEPAKTSPILGFLTATAIGILAYKGFTTITNSGAELVEPKKNVGRAIILSIAACVVLYLLVALAVAGSLSIDEIVAARDYALAEAAKPVFGKTGVTLTVVLAIVATVSGVIASVFAVSRMLAMLTDMDLVPHKHFGMPGRVQKHTLVYTIVLAIVLTIFLDLSRIATIGAIFYIVMDIAIHWGVLRHIREEVKAKAWVLITALCLDAVVLSALLWTQGRNDPLVLVIAGVGFILIFMGERWFLRSKDDEGDSDEHTGH